MAWLQAMRGIGAKNRQAHRNSALLFFISDCEYENIGWQRALCQPTQLHRNRG
jgi:hypothetical protein